MKRRARIRVLVAEDDPNVREALSALIAGEEDFELVAVAESAPEAIEAAAVHLPDVALLDVRMPGGGGPAAARGISERSPESKVVALSAFEDRSAVLEMLEAGAVGYLVKGSSIDGIIDSIARAAAGQGSLSVEVTNDVIDELVQQLAVRRRGSERRRRQRARIQKAIKEPGGLNLVFQPIFSLGSNDHVGVEALARFRLPPKRPPDRWFAEAEDVGLRVELELAAVRRVLAALPEVPRRLYVSLNASPDTVATPQFHDLLQESHPRRVVVEVTEHAPVADYAALSGSLAALRSLGVRLAIDDAGAGFASLRHILELAPDFIKLDRSLIAGIEGDLSQQALAMGLISFADRIGAVIVAEGIESAGAVAALRELGVTYGQGFFLAEPAPLASSNGSRSAARAHA